MLKSIFLILFLLLTTLNAYQSEDKLQAMVVGKVAKYITWDNTFREEFIITILKNPFDNLFDKLYTGKTIKSKNVKIVYIDSIEELENTNILYIPNSQASKLKYILKHVQNKNILTVSNIRGFAEKKGMLQLYFVSQKIKLKINLDVTKEENLNIKSTLLRIATVIKGG